MIEWVYFNTIWLGLLSLIEITILVIWLIIKYDSSAAEFIVAKKLESLYDGMQQKLKKKPNTNNIMISDDGKQFQLQVNSNQLRLPSQNDKNISQSLSDNDKILELYQLILFKNNEYLNLQQSISQLNLFHFKNIFFMNHYISCLFRQQFFDANVNYAHLMVFALFCLTSFFALVVLEGEQSDQSLIDVTYSSLLYSYLLITPISILILYFFLRSTALINIIQRQIDREEQLTKDQLKNKTIFICLLVLILSIYIGLLNIYQAHLFDGSINEYNYNGSAIQAWLIIVICDAVIIRPMYCFIMFLMRVFILNYSQLLMIAKQNIFYKHLINMNTEDLLQQVNELKEEFMINENNQQNTSKELINNTIQQSSQQQQQQQQQKQQQQPQNNKKEIIELEKNNYINILLKESNQNIQQLQQQQQQVPNQQIYTVFNNQNAFKQGDVSQEKATLIEVSANQQESSIQQEGNVHKSFSIQNDIHIANLAKSKRLSQQQKEPSSYSTQFSNLLINPQDVQSTAAHQDTNIKKINLEKKLPTKVQKNELNESSLVVSKESQIGQVKVFNHFNIFKATFSQMKINEDKSILFRESEIIKDSNKLKGNKTNSFFNPDSISNIENEIAVHFTVQNQQLQHQQQQQQHQLSNILDSSELKELFTHTTQLEQPSKPPQTPAFTNKNICKFKFSNTKLNKDQGLNSSI